MKLRGANTPDEGIDNDEITASTQDDVLSWHVKEFKSEDYSSIEAMLDAVKAYHEENIRTGEVPRPQEPLQLNRVAP